MNSDEEPVVLPSQPKPPEHGDLRVWWIPQVPGMPFYVQCHSVADAVWLTIVLADYDQFQLDNHIKPDYANAGGVEVYDSQLAEEDEEGNGWVTLEKEDCLRIIEAACRHMTILDPVQVMRGEV